MLFRFIFLLIGYGLASFGGISIIAFLNLMTAGYSFQKYIKFITTRVEFFLFLFGLLLILLSIFSPSKKR